MASIYLRIPMIIIVLGGFLAIGVTGLLFPRALQRAALRRYSDQRRRSPKSDPLWVDIADSEFFVWNARIVGALALAALAGVARMLLK